jgi:hypothetical protein
MSFFDRRFVLVRRLYGVDGHCRFFTPWGMTIILVPLPVLIVCVWPIARAAFEGKTRKLNDLADSERD